MTAHIGRSRAELKHPFDLNMCHGRNWPVDEDIAKTTPNELFWELCWATVGVFDSINYKFDGTHVFAAFWRMTANREAGSRSAIRGLRGSVHNPPRARTFTEYYLTVTHRDADVNAFAHHCGTGPFLRKDDLRSLTAISSHKRWTKLLILTWVHWNH